MVNDDAIPLIPWANANLHNDPWGTIIKVIGLLPKYEHQRSDINFIYTEDMKRFDEMNKELSLKNIPEDELQQFKDDFISQAGNEPIRVKNRINCYTCPSGHNTVTIDINHGTTPMFLGCKTCGQQATSHMYRCDQTLIPAYEWYAPNPAECKEYELDHVLSGGLLLREYTGAELSQEQLKDMYKFQKDFKHKNPNFTQRQFKRAFLKKFPNLLK